MLSRTTLLATGLAAALCVGPTTGQAAPAPYHAPAKGSATKPKVTDGCLRSVPDPGTTAKVQICYTIFRPARVRAGARHARKVPVLMHSHGWGGSRTTDPAAFKDFLDTGYGVLSFDQRGFGESGGHAYVENPTVEGHDVRALVNLIASRKWVLKDGPGDPRLGAIGGSYGGGYQFLAAFEELRVKGKPVFDALAPEITWHDLSQSLAPDGVVRTEWALALSAAAVPSDALPPSVYKALAEGVLTGQWPDGSLPGFENLNEFFERNGPRWHIRQGRRLDIPLLFGQGMTDGLFNAQQGLDNWRKAISRKARRHSIFVGYNGGHVLPSVFPQGINVTSDPCSKKLAGDDFAALALRFFDEHLKGKDTGLEGWNKLHLATPGSKCVTIGSDRANKAYGVGQVVTATTAGVPTVTKVVDGPIRVAGLPHVTAKVTSLTPDSRIFYGLAVGTNATDAKLVQNNVMPLREPTAVSGVRRTFTLPAVAVDVPKGQTLFLLATPVSDLFVGMGSRPPGVITLDNTRVHVRVVAH